MAKAKKISANELPQDVVDRIRADVEAMRNGTYDTEQARVGPACICGLNPRANWIPEGLADYAGTIDRGCHRHGVVQLPSDL